MPSSTDAKSAVVASYRSSVMTLATLGDPTPTDNAHPTKLRLFILSDVCILCEGLALALSQEPSVTVVGSADLSAPASQIAEHRPDVLLLDITRPRGLEMSRSLRGALPNARIVAIAVAEVDQEIIACAEAGVSGFVSRQGSIRDVIAAAQSAVRGELVCSPRTAALLFCSLRTPPEASTTAARNALTARERQIAELLNEGLSNKEIARLLRIQHATVKNHIHNILGKLQLRRRSQVGTVIKGTAPRISEIAVSGASTRTDGWSIEVAD